MGRARAMSCCSSSSTESSSNLQLRRRRRNNNNLSTDLSLGLGISSNHVRMISGDYDDEAAAVKAPPHIHVMRSSSSRAADHNEEEINEGGNSASSATFYVKVYMEGIPIGRKLDLLAHDGYHDLIRTLDYMFNTNIIWSDSEMDGSTAAYAESSICHVLTYADREGDWMMVGDVPWEMFLSTVRRLKITRAM